MSTAKHTTAYQQRKDLAGMVRLQVWLDKPTMAILDSYRKDIGETRSAFIKRLLARLAGQ